MNAYYLNGKGVSERIAYAIFRDYSPIRYESDQEGIASKWDDCQKNEEERDLYLPDGLEIVQRGE